MGAEPKPAAYVYTQELLGLDRCRPVTASRSPSPLSHIRTPLIMGAWRAALNHHPDSAFADYILRGLSQGFRVGFQYGVCSVQQESANMWVKDEQVVTEYIKKEVEADRLITLPTAEAARLGIHCSPLGIIPKKSQPGKWRLIVNLSAPTDASVNDGIKKELCSLAYTSVDVVAKEIVRLGSGTVLAKMDIKQAYRVVPVHPDDRWLLGVTWQGKVYVDKVLPFGLRSAPMIFSALADALAWIMKQRGVTFVVHYIDDFITLGRPGSEECQRNNRIMLGTCSDTDTPVEAGKCEGPCTMLTFLGIEIDCEAMELRLPQKKLAKLLEALDEWRGKKACRKKALQSLIGSLSHACKVVKSGRSFLRRLIDLAKLAKHPNHYVRLNTDARSDIEWWWQFASTWNGISMMFEARRESCDVALVSDASGSWGCGAYCNGKWFQLQWAGLWANSHIAIKELTPIVLAAAVWGRGWSGKSVMAHCDNAAVVSVINSGSSKDPDLMHLTRCLTFIKVKFDFALFSSHVPGVNNELADALSHNNLPFFLRHYPQAEQRPSTLSPELLDLVVVRRPDWTSRLWTDLWNTIFEQA